MHRTARRHTVKAKARAVFTDAPSAGAGQRGAEERRGGRADKAKRTRLRARGVVRRHTPGGLGPRGEGAAGGEGLRRARSRARAGRGVGKGRAGGSVESLRGSSQGRPGGCRGRPRAAGPVFPLGTVRRPPPPIRHRLTPPGLRGRRCRRAPRGSSLAAPPLSPSPSPPTFTPRLSSFTGIGFK